MSTPSSSWTTAIIIVISAVVLLGPAAHAQTGPEHPENYVCKTVTYPSSGAYGGGPFFYYCQPPSSYMDTFGWAGCGGNGSVSIKVCTSKCAPPQEETAYISQTALYVPDLGSMAVPLKVPGPKVSLDIPSEMFAGKTYAGSVSSDSPGLSTISISAPAPFGGTQPDASGNFSLSPGVPQNNQSSQTVTVTASMCGVSTSREVTIYASNNVPPLNLKTDCASCGQPINLANGNVWITQQDYSNPGLGGGLSLNRTWNSLYSNWEQGIFSNWGSSLEQRLIGLDLNTKMYWSGDGDTLLFRYQNDQWKLTTPPDMHATLTFDTATTLFTMALPDGTIKTFNNAGLLTQIADRNGNATTIAYDGDYPELPAHVTDATGRVLSIHYSTIGGIQVNFPAVSSISDATGTIATYSYNTLRLSSVTYADGSSRHYEYNDVNGVPGFVILNVKDGNGRVLEAHTYDSQNRGLTSQRADGAELVTVSYPSIGVANVTDSKGNTTVYKTSLISGGAYILSSDGPGCVTCKVNGTNSFAYDGAGNLLYSVDGLHHVKSYTYDANGNVTSVSSGATQPGN